MGIPLRTIEEWEAGRRKMPDYVLRLISYQVKMEKGLKVNKEEVNRTFTRCKARKRNDGQCCDELFDVI